MRGRSFQVEQTILSAMILNVSESSQVSAHLIELVTEVDRVDVVYSMSAWSHEILSERVTYRIPGQKT